MTILAFPTSVPAPNTMSFGLAANTQSGGRSPFDGTEQTLELPGARWVAELRWHDLDAVEQRILKAFVVSLRGRAGRFTWSPIVKFPRRGTAGGSGAVIFGPGQTGSTLVTGQWSPGLALAAGDILGYQDPTGRSMLHMATADAVSDGTNPVSISISPPIRRSPPNGAPLNIDTPSPVWRLQRDDVMADFEPGEHGFAVTLPIEEAIW